MRQGCPLSPLLFIICIDPLLRRLSKWFPDATVRAYADDNAMVTPNFHRDGAGIMHVYREFGLVSNLRLNLPKTVLVPLWPTTAQRLKSTVLRDVFPEWCSADVCTWSLYLGFAQGPGRASHTWDKPVAKYNARVGMWSGTALGMHYTAKVYNTFAFSTLSFVWQLTDVPPNLFEAEKNALRKLTPGPGMWRLPEDLFYLREFFGQTLSFKSIRHVSLASKLRVAVLDGLSVKRRARELQQAFASTPHLDRLAQWHEWYHSSHLLVLDRALLEASALGVDGFKVYQAI